MGHPSLPRPWQHKGSAPGAEGAVNLWRLPQLPLPGFFSPFFSQVCKAEESQNSTKEEPMKSNNQLGMPLPFYWSPIVLLALLSPGSAVILQLMGSREKLRQDPNINLQHVPKNQVFDQKIRVWKKEQRAQWEGAEGDARIKPCCLTP